MGHREMGDEQRRCQGQQTSLESIWKLGHVFPFLELAENRTDPGASGDGTLHALALDHNLGPPPRGTVPNEPKNCQRIALVGLRRPS
jgi:hypothetical protein